VVDLEHFKNDKAATEPRCNKLAGTKFFKVPIWLAYIHVQGQGTWNQYRKVI